ncbi:LysR family transcriptional regulator [Ramlibacter sp. AW1]|uniref:LysR family transcriptional regulator n=1 Tax=Ramlibacter aurantiacus TaxID=2801330 RepID=A0A936ZKK1_9BURK|nr:LysR family transcriptional regulator [Ramlibacter aurantiacus]MBL0419416.1 LysR family transcriptional regulator [Ramlibacter aurantiacus]
MDTLANLRAFVTAAETGSFSEAARRAGVAPSVIAKRVDQLEWRIRAPLFTRTTRKLTLTDVGERYLPVLRQLVAQLEDTLNGMSRATGALEGHIRVKVPTTLGVLCLGPMLNGFLREQPLVSLEVVLADRSVNPVEEGFDLALGARPESYGGVQDHPMAPVTRRLVASPAYLARAGVPQAVSDLSSHDCLVFSTSGVHWELQGRQGLVGVDVRTRLRSNDGLALLEAAQAGLGIALLADYLAVPGLRTGLLQEVLPETRPPDLWLKAMVPAARNDLPRIRALVQWLSDQLAQLALGEGFLWAAHPANDRAGRATGAAGAAASAILPG